MCHSSVGKMRMNPPRREYSCFVSFVTAFTRLTMRESFSWLCPFNKRLGLAVFELMNWTLHQTDYIMNTHTYTHTMGSFSINQSEDMNVNDTICGSVHTYSFWRCLAFSPCSLSWCRRESANPKALNSRDRSVKNEWLWNQVPPDEYICTLILRSSGDPHFSDGERFTSKSQGRKFSSSMMSKLHNRKHENHHPKPNTSTKAFVPKKSKAVCPVRHEHFNCRVHCNFDGQNGFDNHVINALKDDVVPIPFPS